jgi:2-dehydro-3-deoxygluconokinase
VIIGGGVGGTSIAYHRRGSAASGMQPDDVPPQALDGASFVHLSGITLALGEGPRALVLDVARRARAAGAIVTFDPNFRPALWESPAAAAAAIEPVLDHVSWYLCGSDDPLYTEDALVQRGVDGVVVRTAGSALVIHGGERTEVPAGREAVVDEVGAGDAFAAGFVYGLLEGRPPREAAQAGHTIAVHALRGTGDWETLPRLDEVRGLLSRQRTSTAAG